MWVPAVSAGRRNADGFHIGLRGIVPSIIRDVIEVVEDMPAGPSPDLRDDRLDGVVAPDAFVVRRGRPKKSVDKELLGAVLRMYFVEKLSMRRIADVVGVSHMSVYRMLSDPSVELLI